MRPSQRARILDAALQLVSAGGGAEITLDAAARQAGVTKPGLMYHFPTKEELMLAVVAHVAERWEQAMLAALEVPFAESTPAQRVRAYVEVAVSGDLGCGDFAIFADAAYRPSLSGPWIDRLARWFDLPPSMPAGERARLTLARLAADGLWVADATGVFPPEAADRAAVVRRIRALTEGSDA